jgi:hypothetical protein
MPVACNTRFHREYSVVMGASDRLNPGERNQVESAVITLFSARSDCSDIKAARECIEASRRNTQAERRLRGHSADTNLQLLSHL